MKSLFFAIAFIFIGIISYANTNSISENIFLENDLECNVDTSNAFGETILIIDLSYDVGWCTFSYTITTTNILTGQSTSQTYTHTVEASSEADCRATAQNWANMHVRLLNAMN